ncbi:MAG: hypothetical protein Q8Q56_03360, partial [Alphaproteobacteria bacterium]|nr:hypothetical protein [Alphaproteobacteria bacterium]
VYTWNTWGYGAMGGFSANRESNLAAYKTGRLQEQIGILFKIFHNSPNAIICLQEVNEQDAGTRTAILNGLKALNVDCEYVEKTGKDLFGQMTLYRKDRYKPVRAFKPTPNGYSSGVAMPFISTADTRQNARVLKVYFEELTGKKRQLAVVNVHLAYNSPNILGLLNELVTYSQGVSSPKPLAVITGDFNDTISARYPSSGKVTVKQVGKSVIWNGTASSTKQTANNVDGFIVVQP